MTILSESEETSGKGGFMPVLPRVEVRQFCSFPSVLDVSDSFDENVQDGIPYLSGLTRIFLTETGLSAPTMRNSKNVPGLGEIES